MDPEKLLNNAELFKEAAQHAIDSMLQQGIGIEDAVEVFNSKMFAISIENQMNGWPVLRIDTEHQKLILDIEGWSKSG